MYTCWIGHGKKKFKKEPIVYTDGIFETDNIKSDIIIWYVIKLLNFS